MPDSSDPNQPDHTPPQPDPQTAEPTTPDPSADQPPEDRPYRRREFLGITVSLIAGAAIGLRPKGPAAAGPVAILCEPTGANDLGIQPDCGGLSPNTGGGGCGTTNLACPPTNTVHSCNTTK